ncbi:MAG: hypothetical protein WCJ39_03930 [bacterium]
MNVREMLDSNDNINLAELTIQIENMLKISKENIMRQLTEKIKKEKISRRVEQYKDNTETITKKKFYFSDVFPEKYIGKITAAELGMYSQIFGQTLKTPINLSAMDD